MALTTHKVTNRTLVVLVTELSSPTSIKKAKDLLLQFGRDLFLACESDVDLLNVLPGFSPNNIIPIVPTLVSQTARWSHYCCAQEAAITYLIITRASFDYAWIVEEDVHFEGANLAKRFVDKMALESTADLLHQNKNMAINPYETRSARKW